MLIWRTRDLSLDHLEEVAQLAKGKIECFSHVEGKYSMILCTEGVAPEGVEVIATRRIFAMGNVNESTGSQVFHVTIWTPSDWGEELCSWYREEHAPILLQCIEWEEVDLRESTIDEGREFHVLHRLSHPSALDSPQRLASRNTPWFRELARNSWFDKPFKRDLYERVS